MRKPATPDIEVEVIDLNAPGGGDWHWHAAPEEPEPPSRRRALASTVAGLALLAGAAVWLADDDAPITAPPATTNRQPTGSTTPARSGDTGVPDAGRFLATPPIGYQIWRVTDSDPRGPAPPQFLRSTVGDDSTTGKWYLVRNAPGPPSAIIDAFAQVVNGQRAYISQTPGSDLRTIRFVTRSGEPTEVVGFGWSDQQLVELATSIDVTDNGMISTLPFDPARSVALPATTATAAPGRLAGEVEYRSSNASDKRAWLTITAPPDDPALAVWRSRFLLEPTLIDPGFLEIHSGRLATDPSRRVAQWQLDGWLITASTNDEAVDLHTFGSSVGRVTDDDWARLAAVAGDETETALSEIRVLVAGEDAGNWQLAAALDGPLQFLLTTPSGTLHSAVNGDGSQPSLRSLAVDGMTYVCAYATDERSLLVVQRPDAEPIVVPLQRVAAGAPSGAVFAFSEPTSFTAQIVDKQTLSPLAEWPTSGE